MHIYKNLTSGHKDSSINHSKMETFISEWAFNPHNKRQVNATAIDGGKV